MGLYDICPKCPDKHEGCKVGCKVGKTIRALEIQKRKEAQEERDRKIEENYFANRTKKIKESKMRPGKRVRY